MIDLKDKIAQITVPRHFITSKTPILLTLLTVISGEQFVGTTPGCIGHGHGKYPDVNIRARNSDCSDLRNDSSICING